MAPLINSSTRSRTIRNQLSARVSVPSLLQKNASYTSDSTSLTTKHPYIWRTPLGETKPFWPSWFTDLSSKFLSSRPAKLLLLAGTDRLDRPLTIAQMQGKYQLHIFPDAGHFIHEDLPEKTAAVIVEFWKRNDRGNLVLPPKVGDLLRMGVDAKGAAGIGVGAVGGAGPMGIGGGLGWGEVGAFAGSGGMPAGNAPLAGSSAASAGFENGDVTVAPWAKKPRAPARSSPDVGTRKTSKEGVEKQKDS